MKSIWPWLALLGLGAYHGINPAMGWLFAVALGLQEKDRRAVLKAIPPIALGHLLSIGVVVGLLWLAQATLPDKVLRYSAAAILFGFGFFRLVRSRHPAWVGMRVGFRDLTLWSFLMASAHGAGLMLVPIIIGWSQGDHTGAAAQHLSHGGSEGHFATQPITGLALNLYWLAAVGIHSVGYLLAIAIIALLVYEKLGLAILRSAWINLDLLWVFALIVSGGVLLLLV